MPANHDTLWYDTLLAEHVALVARTRELLSQFERVHCAPFDHAAHAQLLDTLKQHRGRLKAHRAQLSAAAPQRNVGDQSLRETGFRRLIGVCTPMSPRRRILLIEPHDDTREMSAFGLEALGFDVVPVTDTAQALETAEAHVPDVVVTELVGPDFSVAALVHALRRTTRVPVVVVTARVDPTAKRHAILADCDALLAKPCAPSTLAEIIDRVLARPRVRLEAVSPVRLLERLDRTAARARLLVRQASAVNSTAKRIRSESERVCSTAHVPRAKRRP
jgi:CheY-like chemotaxis protein